ncbi:MAG: glycosyltransferase family 2 protein, partial [Atopobiaceae bacterium]|nr:glycosyltransferase family 2 protein [Atopobiaceae bacterium]
MDFQYRVSVIVPIYNQEPYLENTIACLVSQTIPPKDMEILLIDDGSTDRSPEMCDGYAAKYENVKVVHKVNGGLSDARNCGIDNSHGKYIMYLDGDDTLQEDTVLSVVDFFDEHYDEVDLVTYPSITIKQGRQISPHYRYMTFNEPGVYDLTLSENVFAAVTRIEVCVKNEGLNNVKFSSDRTFRHEDMKYCTDVLLRKLKVGFCDKGAYIYAQQADGLQNTYFYAYYLFEPTMAFWEEEFGKFEGDVPKYLQALYISDLSWKLRASILEPLHYSEKDLVKANARIDALLNRCDVDSITKHPAVDSFYRAYLLQRRSVSEVKSVAGSNALALVVDNHLSYVRQKIEIVLFRAKHSGGRLTLYGMLKSPCFQFGGMPELFANVSVDGTRTRDYVNLSESSWCYNGSKTRINTFYDFEFTLDVNERGSVEFYVNYEGETLATNYYFMGTAAFSMSDPRRTQILDADDYLYTFLNNAFFVRKIEAKERRKLNKEIRLEGEYSPKKALSRRSAEQLIAQGRRIWLYHDCHGVEKNNAYEQYMHDIQMDDGIERYYVVNDSLRSKRHLFTAAQMKRVIRFESKQHKLLFLAAERIITAYVERNNWIPFGPNLVKYYQDLFHAEVVYLQHGVLHSHQPWKYSRDRILIDKEVVSTQFEIDNLKNNYCFTDETILA